jgi:poly-gamma-glutamate system protein
VRYVEPKVRLSRLAVSALTVVVAVIAAERVVRGGHDALRVRAAHQMEHAIALLRTARIERGLPFSPDDVTKTGIIGDELTPLVTTLGSLPAKRMSTDPGFAALVVDLLRAVGVKEGDVIAVGFSGSLPGLNIAVLSAAAALNLEAVVISSVGASQWGATDPQFTWLDMERVLFERGVFHFRSAAATRSGGAKTNFLLEEGKDLARAVIRRSGVPELTGGSFADIVRKRMAIYLERARGRPIKAFVNVGGAAANVGQCDQSKIIAGIVRRIPPCAEQGQGLIHKFLRMRVPVIHLLQVQRLARTYGMTLHGFPGGAVEDGREGSEDSVERPMVGPRP